MRYRPGPAGFAGRGAGQCRGGAGVEVGRGVQTQHPERPAGIGGEAVARPGEHCPHRRGLIAGVQQVKPGLPGQRGGKLAERDSLTSRGKLSGDPQRERQPAALAGQRADGLWIGGGPVANQVPEQRLGIGGRQDVQAQAARAVPRHQPGE
jgi:hypothetical protein